MGRPATSAVHGGTPPDPATGGLVPPIHQTTTYAQEGLGQHQGFTYTRSGNPTVVQLEERLRALSGGIGAVAFGSGMAAIDAVLRATLSPGDHVIASDVVYGGTVRLLRASYEPYGVGVDFVDAVSAEGLEGALGEETRLVLLETPANPTLKLTDLTACIDVAHEAGVPVAVDNTFLTPLGQPVLELGADLAIHSTTKYLEGHGTTLGGAVIVQEDPDLLEALRFQAKTAGSPADPFQAWLTLRGIQTLPLRIECVSATAQALAEALEDHPAVDRVRYPGLASFPQHDLAEGQHEHHGGLLAFELAGGRQAVDRFVDGFEHLTLAEHLGTTQTLVTHPATMTHASLTAEERAEHGITDGLLRISAGLEDPDDLVEDLTAALDRATAVPAGGTRDHP